MQALKPRPSAPWQAGGCVRCWLRIRWLRANIQRCPGVLHRILALDAFFSLAFSMLDCSSRARAIRLKSFLSLPELNAPAASLPALSNSPHRSTDAVHLYRAGAVMLQTGFVDLSGGPQMGHRVGSQLIEVVAQPSLPCRGDFHLSRWTEGRRRSSFYLKRQQALDVGHVGKRAAILGWSGSTACGNSRSMRSAFQRLFVAPFVLREPAICRLNVADGDASRR